MARDSRCRRRRIPQRRAGNRMSHAQGRSGQIKPNTAPANRAIPAALPSCGIAVMAKASSPGLTKTRLVPPLSYEEAAAFNTAFLQDVADNLLAAGRSASIGAYM